MAIWIPLLVWKVVVRHDFATDESLKRKGGEHVEPKAASMGESKATFGAVSFGTIDSYNLAMLTIMLSVGKLLRTFPCVLSPKVR